MLYPLSYEGWADQGGYRWERTGGMKLGFSRARL
ncbi:MAG: hypothetical protein JWM72_1436, partial [Actinomycetia bacterium]|nr:hypothetical protein [Actinomycetes bacterium]